MQCSALIVYIKIFATTLFYFAAGHRRSLRWNFVGGGYGSVRESVGRSPPTGSRGGAPVGGLWDEVAQKLKHFCIYNDKFGQHVEGHGTTEVISFWRV